MPDSYRCVDFAERVRELNREVPVVLATGYMEGLPDATPCAASFPTLIKPYRLVDLAELVSSTLACGAADNPTEGFQHEG